MEKGTIVEYIDHEKMICALVLEVGLGDNKRLRVLTENSRETNLPERRVTYAGGRLDVSSAKSELAEQLKQASRRRADLASGINVAELWEVLSGEGQWISVATMTALCFPKGDSPDHEAAVIRAMFFDRLYFKFDHDKFFPHTEEQVKAIQIKRDKEARRQRLINEGAAWLKEAVKEDRPRLPESGRDIVDLLQSYYIFSKDAPDAALAKTILTNAGNVSPDTIFALMVRLGEWDKNENIDFYRYELPVAWPAETDTHVSRLSATLADIVNTGNRRDLTALPVFTVDGSATLDFDDALSLEFNDDATCRVGVHISDVAAWIEPESWLDREAFARGSSIYTADRKIAMLPEGLSEGMCSLLAEEVRPAISTFMTFSTAPTADGEILDYEIVASAIRVVRHLTYTDVDRDLNQLDNPPSGGSQNVTGQLAKLDQSDQLQQLHALACLLRNRRTDAGALTIAIPEMDVRVDGAGRVSLNIIDRYSRARSMVEEMMIAANQTAARFLRDQNVPAIYRSQMQPKQRLVKKEDAPGTLFQNWVQRKMLPRAVLDRKPERHAGLGVDMYTTVTSPIRKYLDLITQRQIRSALGLGQTYTAREIDDLLMLLGPRLGQVGRIQQGRQRYWVLKHLETLKGKQVDGLILDAFKNDYAVLLPDFLLECRMSRSSGVRIRPGEALQLTIQHVNARNDVITVFPG